MEKMFGTCMYVTFMHAWSYSHSYLKSVLDIMLLVGMCQFVGVL